MKVLIVEDSPEIVEAISLAFQIRWPEAQLVSTHLGERGIELVEIENPDVVILDLKLTDVSGYEVLKRIRLFSNVPILILSVLLEESDIIKGLEWGADDYMVKPFRQLELLSRIRALIRRRAPEVEEVPLVCSQLHFDPSINQLLRGDKKISLTPTEGRILHHLMRNAGRVVKHADLSESVWGEVYPGAVDSLKVHIRRLREKVETDPSAPQIIITMTGIGYMLAKPN